MSVRAMQADDSIDAGLSWQVFFFDDKRNNVLPFTETAYNARQISCGSRDSFSGTGLCGGTPAEVVRFQGVIPCMKRPLAAPQGQAVSPHVPKGSCPCAATGFAGPRCFHDDSCPGLGCGALGIEQCRYCGAQQFYPCPVPLVGLPTTIYESAYPAATNLVANLGTRAGATIPEASATPTSSAVASSLATGSCRDEVDCAAVWENLADGYTCGSRIQWLQKFRGQPSSDACDQVANEFPSLCGSCRHIQ